VRLLLASQGLGALAGFLRPGERRAAWITAAAEPLGRPAWLADVRAELERSGLEVREVDPSEELDADLVVVSGGDPFHLLGRLRGTPVAGTALPWVGISAGAVVTAPDLRPVTMTSPFAPPPGAPLDGLGLAPLLVLPHDGREGRAALNAAAVAAHPELAIEALRDDEAVVVEDGAWRRVAS